MNTSLPLGWKITTLGEVCSKPQYGWTCRSARQGRIKYIRTTDISDGEIDWSSVPFCEETPDDIEKYRVHPDDILVSRAGSVGTSYRIKDVPCNAVFASYLIRFKPFKDINPKFLEFFLRSDSYWRSISEFSAGIAVPNVNASKLASLKLALPPPNEQNRIVKTLDKTLSQLESSKRHLEAIPRILKRFRQSILASACSGRLTADWRFANPTVSAQQLIANLKTVEPQNYMDVFERSSAGEIPSTWGWVRLGKLGNFLGGGTPSKNNLAYWNGKIPWVSPKDMKRDRINDSQDHITSKALEKSTAKLIPKGSILFVVRGMILNHTLPTAITDVEITLNQDMKALVPEIKEMNEYLFWVSKHISTAMLFEVKEATHGTRRIETPFLKNWAIPVPPIDEQREIVKRIQNLMALSNQIEARYIKAKMQIDKLSQAILGKAFRGELLSLTSHKVSEEKASQQRKPNLKTEVLTNQSVDVICFRSIVPRREEKYVSCVPSLELQIAAGAFGEDQRPDFNEWVQINTSRPLKKGMFVAKVVGRSMEPLIPDGAHCLFQFKAPQLRNDMVAVFQLHDSEDPESGGHYTVKRLRVYRQNTDEGVVRKAKLMPENPAFQPITVDEDNVKFVAEFLEVLQPLTKVKNRLR